MPEFLVIVAPRGYPSIHAHSVLDREETYVFYLHYNLRYTVKKETVNNNLLVTLVSEFETKDDGLITSVKCQTKVYQNTHQLVAGYNYSVHIHCSCILQRHMSGNISRCILGIIYIYISRG